MQENSFKKFLFVGLLFFFVANLSTPTYAVSQFGKLPAIYEDWFSQNDILFYEAGECGGADAGAYSSLLATGRFEDIGKAKNADKSFFNGSGDVPSAQWSDSDIESQRRLLETYGDLAYQLGRVVGAPYIAILVQMRYEDPQSVCGANNFWGNGCDSKHAYAGGSTIQGKNLGEGFAQYGKTLLETELVAGEQWYGPALGIADPVKYLETLGPLWVQGSKTGAGYANIAGMRKSVAALTSFIESADGQAIVREFYNYDGSNPSSPDSSSDSSSSSSSSSSSHGEVSGSDITWIGDSYSVGAKSIIEEKFPGISFRGSAENSKSYIQSNKGVGKRYCGASNSCNRNPAALTILKEIVNKGELKHYLVMAIGTNAGWDDSEVQEFQSIMSSHSSTKVIFTTVKAKAHLAADNIGTNDRLKKLVESNKNYFLADWAAAYKDEYFESNSVHPNANGGYEKWVDIIYDAVSASASSSGYQDTTQWKDGWITDGFEGFVREPAEGSSYQLPEESKSIMGGHTQEYATDGKPNKILLHSTEGGKGSGNSGLALYGTVTKGGMSGITPAHFTINLQDKKVFQHFSIDKPSDAIKEDLAAGIQIEIIGFKDKGSSPSLQDYSNEDWEYLAKLLISISNQTGIKLESSADWTKESRYSVEDFHNYTGVLGHMHAPVPNDHLDPGDIWSKVKSAIDRLQSGTESQNFCDAQPHGDFESTLLSFAWTMDELNAMGVDQWSGTLEVKPGYKEAYDRRVKEGKYVGSRATYGDCGGFVTTLMNESGYEPEYDYAGKGGNTTYQKRWLDENWELVGVSGGSFDTSQLQQGDVYIRVHDNGGHTFVYVGDVEGFGSNVASASWDTRVPQASGNSASESGYNVYRKRL